MGKTGASKWKEFDELLKTGGRLIDYECDIRSGDVHRFRKKLKDFISQNFIHKSLLKEKVENMEAPIYSEYDLEAVHEGYFQALTDLLKDLDIK